MKNSKSKYKYAQPVEYHIKTIVWGGKNINVLNGGWLMLFDKDYQIIGYEVLTNEQVIKMLGVEYMLWLFTNKWMPSKTKEKPFKNYATKEKRQSRRSPARRYFIYVKN